jgi:hypothetical protein
MKKTSNNNLIHLKKEHSDFLLGMHEKKFSQISTEKIYLNILKDMNFTYEYLENLFFSFVNLDSSTIDYSEISLITGEYLTHIVDNEDKVTSDKIEKLKVT